MAHSGKTMTFQTDLKPYESEVYSLGDATHKWLLNGDVPVLQGDLSGLGAGDMLKSTYDTNDDGIVDAAATLGGKTASDFVLKAGDTMTGLLYMIDESGVVPASNGYGHLTFYDTNKNWATSVMRAPNNSTRFVERSGTTDYYEVYLLPAPDANRTANANYNILTTKSTVTVPQGGTGATTFASGEALIGNGTSAVTTRAIKNNTTAGAAGWTSATGTSLITLNTLAYWNGRYSGSSSNLQYCKLGEFGSMAVASADDYLPITGGTLTGPLTIHADTTTAADTPAKLAFTTTDTDVSKSYNNAYIGVFNDHVDAYGANMVIQSGGGVFIGGGESPHEVYLAIRGSGTYNGEQLYLSADSGGIYFDTACNCNTGNAAPNRVGMVLDNSGQLVPTVADIATNNKGNLGTSNYRWNGAYVNALNASSATVSGDTTIGGILKINNNKDLRMVDNVITQGTTPSSNHYGGGLHLCDSANTDLGYVRQLYLANGGSGVQIEAWRKVSDANKYSTLNLYVASDGTAIANSNANWTFSGSVTVSGTSKFNFSGIEAASGNSARPVWFAYDGRTGTPVYSTNFTYNPSTKVLTVGSVTGNLTGNVTGNCSGSAGSVAWGNVTSRPSNAGSSTQPVYWSSNAAVAVTQPASGAWFSSVPMINSSGVMEVGRYIDFHNSNTGTSDYDVRMNCTGSGKLTITGTVSGTFSGDLTGDVTGTASGNVAKAGDTMTGPLYINYTTDTSGTNDTGGLIVGDKAGENIAIDSNELLARKNKAASTLYIQSDGGSLTVGNATAATTRFNGLFSIYTTGTSYNQGIRLHGGKDGTADLTCIMFCGSDNTGATGTSAKTWGLLNNEGNLYLSLNGYKTSSSAILSCVSNAWSLGGSSATVSCAFTASAGATFSNKSFNYSGIETGTSNNARAVWFSDASTVGKPCVNTNTFTHNPYNGSTVVKNSTAGTDVTVQAVNTGRGNLGTYLDTANSGNHGVYSNGYWNGSEFVSGGKWLVYRNTSNVITVNGNCTGTSANVTGTVAIGHGGTGATTAVAARKALCAWNSTTTWTTAVSGANSGMGEIIVRSIDSQTPYNHIYYIYMLRSDLTTSKRSFASFQFSAGGGGLRFSVAASTTEIDTPILASYTGGSQSTVTISSTTYYYR